MPRPIFPALLLTIFMSACSPPPVAEVLTEPPVVSLPESVQQLSAEQAAALMQSTPDLIILDLREDWEIKKEGRIAGSIWADALNEERFAEATGKLDKSRPCLLYCAIGGREQLAAVKLSGQGFEKLFLLSGGLEAWIKDGQAVQK